MTLDDLNEMSISELENVFSNPDQVKELESAYGISSLISLINVKVEKSIDDKSVTEIEFVLDNCKSISSYFLEKYQVELKNYHSNTIWKSKYRFRDYEHLDEINSVIDSTLLKEVDANNEDINYEIYCIIHQTFRSMKTERESGRTPKDPNHTEFDYLNYIFDNTKLSNQYKNQLLYGTYDGVKFSPQEIIAIMKKHPDIAMSNLVGLDNRVREAQNGEFSDENREEIKSFFDEKIIKRMLNENIKLRTFSSESLLADMMKTKVIENDNPEERASALKFIRSCIENPEYEFDRGIVFRSFSKGPKSEEYQYRILSNPELSQKTDLDMAFGNIEDVEILKRFFNNEQMELTTKTKTNLAFRIAEPEYIKAALEKNVETDQRNLVDVLGLIIAINDKEYAQEFMKDNFSDSKEDEILKKVVDFIYEPEKYLDENQELQTIDLPVEFLQYGIEIESGGKRFSPFTRLLQRSGRRTEKINGWSVVGDGSGIEFSSPILKNNEESVKSIYETCNFLSEEGNEITEEDGGHIHFDSKMLKDKDAYINLMEMYLNCEEIMYAIANEKGTAHRGLKADRPMSRIVEEFLKNEKTSSPETESMYDFKKKLKEVQQDDKFFGINFLHLKDSPESTEYDTIEFRLANGTLSPDVWIQNINLFGGMMVAAQRLSDIMNKEEPLTQEEAQTLESFEKLKDSKTTDREKLEILLNLAIQNEEKKQIYEDRYDTNIVLNKENEEFASEMDEYLATGPVVLDSWRPNPKNIKKCCFSKDNLRGESVDLANLSDMENMLDRDCQSMEKELSDEITQE